MSVKIMSLKQRLKVFAGSRTDIFRESSSPATENALSPNLVLVRGTMQFMPSEERSRRCDEPLSHLCINMVRQNSCSQRFFGSFFYFKAKFYLHT